MAEMTLWQAAAITLLSRAFMATSLAIYRTITKRE